MWLLYARAPKPDASPWPGRRLLALIDALAWPGLLAALGASPLVDAGVFRSVTLAACVLVAARRSARALWRNERYRFTTVNVGTPIAVLLALGVALELTI